MAKWLADIAWDKRSREFGELKIAEGSGGIAMPIMEMLLPSAPNRDVVDLWIGLSHPNILEAVAHSESVVVRYAALDWTRIFSAVRLTVANWGMQLVTAYMSILEDVRPSMLGLFLRPVVKIDLSGQIRLAFPAAEREDTERFPADLRRVWPRCDEDALVFAVGLLLRQLDESGDSGLETAIVRATDENRRRRIKTLAELEKLLYAMSTARPVRDRQEHRAYKLFEEGLGWLALDRPHTALECFEDARAIDNVATLRINEAIDVARERLGMGRDLSAQPSVRRRWIDGKMRTVKAEPSAASPPKTWHPLMSATDAEAQGKRLECERAFAEALATYRHVTEETPALLIGRARCHLQLDEPGLAIDYAQRALAGDPTLTEAQEIAINGMLRRRDYAQALKRATLFVQAHSKHAFAHYLRGKALFTNGRIEEARDSFDRASALDSQLLAAQLLRRECERALGNVRKSVGSQHAPTFEIPEQLAELRDVLISGDIPAAIEALRDERYARDADARLLLARFLMFDGRVEAALAIFDELTATSHREAALVGKGTALLQLGRAGAALAIFDQLRENADAAEGAARAYEQLGLLDAAADAYKRFVALATNSSDLRVRAARDWLANR